jgi:hypothetical protein
MTLLFAQHMTSPTFSLNKKKTPNIAQFITTTTTSKNTPPCPALTPTKKP